MRAEALELYASHGQREASERTGVPSSTIRSWARRAQVDVGAAARTLDVVEVVGRPGVTWAQRRPAFIAGLGQTLDLAKEQLDQALTEGRARDARDLVIVTGVLVDKAELLSGGATSRHDSRSMRVDVDLASIERANDQLRREIAELQEHAE